jgi:hypothetical protein
MNETFTMRLIMGSPSFSMQTQQTNTHAGQIMNGGANSSF